MSASMDDPIGRAIERREKRTLELLNLIHANEKKADELEAQGLTASGFRAAIKQLRRQLEAARDYGD